MVKVAISGFGRIGKLVLRAALKQGVFGKGFDVVAINGTADPKTDAHLLKYDSVHGVAPNKIEAADGAIIIDGKKITYLSERDPEKLPWAKFGVELVLECTGAFTNREGASKHLTAGAKKVLISAPAKGEIDATIVLGVNGSAYDKSKHAIISTASCTTNCLAPMVSVLNSNFKIKRGYMTTVHAYTNDQPILDHSHTDLRRARAAALSIIPTTTGAATALGLVIPEVAGKLDGIAVRVPVPDGSLTDLVVELGREVTKEEINAAFKAAAQGPMKGVLEYTDAPIVSCDVVGNPHSCIFDSLSTMVLGKSKNTLVKVMGWYDNEWGFSNRMVELALKMC
ncbi:MAG: type I glyceraldehyde-3-phosphate dehydrogenase [Candidatus Burarchaeum sp.]|nr:type I glyceraldehyde-3-phosphate dehydrogenase [Candidatus Burarchaeum sp.]MDO8339796.1 type I glyceraldehyde-3-phosphate dehydrogenase [Candidatus Burarchaeum sp.]